MALYGTGHFLFDDALFRELCGLVDNSDKKATSEFFDRVDAATSRWERLLKAKQEDSHDGDID